MATSSTKIIRIAPIGFHSAIAIAADELGHYLPRLAPVMCRVLTCCSYPPQKARVQILLGTSEHLNPRGLRNVPALSDCDDAFLIKEFRAALYLIGSNPRSVLYAAYRLLEHFGVRFIRPASEVIPRRKRISWRGLRIRESASYRHRGICIEGAPRLEHVLGLLDWMAKKKMNTYQLQFRHAGAFWRKGYTLTGQIGPEQVRPAEERRRPEVLTDRDCYALDDRVIHRCRELGFIVHRVGHGWTAAAVGRAGIGWAKTRRRVSRSRQSYIALVNGKRAFFKGVPTNTELCYSNPSARDAFVNQVLQYARTHSEVDVIHVWLSDSYNNNCECKACAGKSPSDWYAILINEICQRLEAEELPHRIVFLAYVDMIWPPEQERLVHPKAILMFAPITRCFVHPLVDTQCSEDACLDRSLLNRAVLFRRNRLFTVTAKSWRGKHPGDAFLFDYHLMWACWSDGWGLDMGRIMAQDMKHLDELGLDGMVSCQTQRCFWPHPHTMHAMADMLWNRSLSEATQRRKVFADTYGEAAKLAFEYWNGVVKKTGSGRSYDHKTVFSATEPSTTVKLDNLAAWLSKMQQALRSAAGKLGEPVHRDSLRLLAAHASLTSLLVAARLGALAGSCKRLDKAREKARKRIAEIICNFDLWVDPSVMPAQVEGLFTEMAKEISMPKTLPRTR